MLLRDLLQQLLWHHVCYHPQQLLLTQPVHCIELSDHNGHEVAPFRVGALGCFHPKHRRPMGHLVSYLNRIGLKATCERISLSHHTGLKPSSTPSTTSRTPSCLILH